MSLNPADLDAHRSVLLRYAIYRVRDEAIAEDLVHETLISALEKPDSFDGRAALGTWLTSILKHKILDWQRTAGRETTASVLNEEDVSEFDALFEHSGHWGSDAPRRWAQPESSLEDQQFWAVFRDCQSRMPTRSALVFAMREVHDYAVTDIASELDITPDTCSALLYRARMSLRLCLEKNWFGLAS
ncbi:sigma-70 family RNA polymerase sigma factor [Burkholderiaceae bacterium DAT-1]|nr:sigma-70 family RNA polymerase sigma factor [Burkholderiaceae bacterium DAT-1]